MTRAPLNLREIRRQRGCNQQAFWNRVYVTQSGGSRYESGRDVPAPVAELIRLHYELDIDTRLITAKNAALIRAVLENGIEVTGNEHAAH